MVLPLTSSCISIQRPQDLNTSNITLLVSLEEWHPAKSSQDPQKLDEYEWSLSVDWRAIFYSKLLPSFLLRAINLSREICRSIIILQRPSTTIGQLRGSLRGTVLGRAQIQWRSLMVASWQMPADQSESSVRENTIWFLALHENNLARYPLLNVSTTLFRQFSRNKSAERFRHVNDLMTGRCEPASSGIEINYPTACKQRGGIVRPIFYFSVPVSCSPSAARKNQLNGVSL